MRIVAWPPVGIVGSSPRFERPVERSQTLWSGRSTVATAGPARRLLSLDVSALSRDRAGAGYLHQLWREIDGGVDLVRVQSQPVNWWLDHARLRAMGYTRPMRWTSGGDPAEWTHGGAPAVWFTGPTRAASTGTSDDGYPTITVPDVTDDKQPRLPPGQIVARPGDIIRVYPASDMVTGQTAEVVTVARANAEGAAVIKLASALPAGVVSLADCDTAVYELLTAPEAMQPVSGNWQMRLELREVLPIDIPEDAEEVDPW